ncbi:protein phosphatase 2C domain-containing protein [Bacillus sp. DTU_2020_1000418_1_SI_GHA_SEK_038]|uniref:PP2C family protein-serine/threonine phosphatase n=1 Tax=Bacillus sp. DTU_2020_1000418_1_SI_GHA_SEK_038 TaxID=3077585 RepID=UPI0028EFEEEC|nr:protein phosphatase 2C domain-containing protein [Bacillus sp. DTU_2020_1000418_1_SI_GHA_SEK_038]WNS77451.1 protein phosphatase 2C domain-containing protein [Bacillus sp. DTU_2020_1000418_1_SI_GHA_SEK_038]
MQYRTASISDKGGREVNQDCTGFHESENGGCWVLADGLGGYQAGEVAAKLAVETILTESQIRDDIYWLKDGIDQTQKVIREHLLVGTNAKSMRTTLVVLLCKNNLAAWTHVGDSRLYMIRNGKVLFQTKDHSVCQALVNSGEITADQIRFHEDRNRLFRVLGSEGVIKATFLEKEMTVYPGDSFLLCSDGFWEYVTEEEMENTRLVCSAPSDWLKSMEIILKGRTLENNDNYSAVAVFVSE